jgi:hypothetical protein
MGVRTAATSSLPPLRRAFATSDAVPAPVTGRTCGAGDTVRTLVADTERLRSLTVARLLRPGGRQRA